MITKHERERIEVLRQAHEFVRHAEGRDLTDDERTRLGELLDRAAELAARPLDT
jgi:hypothetical protein